MCLNKSVTNKFAYRLLWGTLPQTSHSMLWWVMPCSLCPSTFCPEDGGNAASDVHRNMKHLPVLCVLLAVGSCPAAFLRTNDYGSFYRSLADEREWGRSPIAETSKRTGRGDSAVRVTVLTNWIQSYNQNCWSFGGTR
jgi:hypothetical protein